MQPPESFDEVLTRARKTLGDRELAKALLSLVESKDEASAELTIISNAGMHAIPSAYIHGTLYPASDGNIDLSTEAAITASYGLVLRKLAEKLKEREWKRIYLIPTGPTTLALQIKLLVYHITRLSTIDLYYSRGNYFELALDYRDYLDLSGSGRD
jgi:hypothetical protein